MRSKLQHDLNKRLPLVADASKVRQDGQRDVDSSEFDIKAA